MKSPPEKEKVAKAVPEAKARPIEEHVELARMPTGRELMETSQAFAQLAALASTGYYPGCKSPADALVICWNGHAHGIHPAIALQEAYVIKGRIGWSWRYKLGIIQARLRGYQLEEVELTEESCTLRGRRGPSHAWMEITYTMADAERQGLVDQNQQYRKSPKDMLFKQAIHRLMDRTARDVLIGFRPPELREEHDEELKAEAPSFAEVVEDGPEPPSPDASDEGVVSWRKQLAALIDRVYDNLGAKERLEIAGKVWTQMQQIAGYAGPPLTFPSWEAIGPADAKVIHDWIATSQLDKQTTAAAKPAPQGLRGEMKQVLAEMHEIATQELEQPSGQATVLPEPEPEGVAAQPVDRRLEFFALADRARKAWPGRSFVKEYPAGSGAWYLVDGPVFLKLGFRSSVGLFKHERPVIWQGAETLAADEAAWETIAKVAVELTALCNAGEQKSAGRRRP